MFVRRSFPRGDRAMVELARSGQIIAGTDAPLIPYGVSVHNELELMVRDAACRWEWDPALMCELFRPRLGTAEHSCD